MIALRAKINTFKKRGFWAWMLIEYTRYWVTLKIPYGLVAGGFIHHLQGRPFLSSNWLLQWNDFLFMPCSLALAYGAATWYRNHKVKQASVSASKSSPHPRNAEFFLWLFLPREGREAAIGDTNEKFEVMLERFGLRRAKLWYWGEVARSAWPLVSYIGERLLKWTFLGSVADWVRRHI
jgi:hypothetical protein